MSITDLYPLKMIYFYLTEGCNLACKHCWLAPRYDPSLKKTAYLPVGLYERVIIDAKPLGLSGVKLTGGEPLLHPQFEQLLEITRQADLFLTIETNGTLCTPRIARQIASFPQRFVSVSLDGADAVTHDSIRGIPGSFAKACEAIKMLAEVGIGPQVIFSVMRPNFKQIDDVIYLAEQLGVTSIKFNVVQPTARGENIHEQGNALSVSEYISIGQKVDNVIMRGTEVELIFDYPPAFYPINRFIHAQVSRCGILGIISVLPKGQYALCGIGEIMPEFVFGQVEANSILEVWENASLLNEIRLGLPRSLEGICHKCLLTEVCLGSCIAQNMYRTHKLWSPYWFCEEAERSGLFPDSRKSDNGK